MQEEIQVELNGDQDQHTLDKEYDEEDKDWQEDEDFRLEEEFQDELQDPCAWQVHGAAHRSVWFPWGMIGVLRSVGTKALRNLPKSSVSSGLCQEEFEELQHIAQEREVKSDGTWWALPTLHIFAHLFCCWGVDGVEAYACLR